MQIADKHRDFKGTAVLAIVCLVLQLALAPNIGLGNGRANFALVFSACFAMTQGGPRSVVVGFFSGLLFDLSSTTPIGLMSFCLTISSYLLGAEARNRMSGDFGGSVLLAAFASLGTSLIYCLGMFFLGQTSSFVDAVVLRALPMALLTIVFFLPFAYYYSRIRTSGANLGAGGGHFSKRGL